jgi:S-layer protein (TIGR01567 family)
VPAEEVNVRSDIHNISENFVSWNSHNFTGFYYDIDRDFGTEELYFLPDVDRTAYSAVLSDQEDDGYRGATYITKAKPNSFSFYLWGQYDEIGFLGKNYFAGYNSTVWEEQFDPILYDESKDKNLLANGQLSEILYDDNFEQIIDSSTPLQLYEGYKLAIRTVDADGNKIRIDLTKDNQLIDSRVISPSIKNATIEDATYYYKRNISETKDIVILAVHFKDAFTSSGDNVATIDGVFQISETPISIEIGQQYDEMSVRSIDPITGTIMLDNKDHPIILSKNRDITLMGNIHIKTADQDYISDNYPLRYYLYCTNKNRPHFGKSHGASKIVNASEILDKIQNREPFKGDHITVVGDLNLSQSDLSTEYVSRNLYEINNLGLSDKQKIVTSFIRINDSLIKGNLILDGTTFDGPMDFSSTSFNGNVNFKGSEFNREAKFTDCRFNGYADFRDSRFYDWAYFWKSTFNKDLDFSDAWFNGSADFWKSIFNSNASFNSSTFNGDTNFEESVFNGTADFNESKFYNNADFWKSIFNSNASFSRSTFNGDTNFEESVFNGTADFNESKFYNNAYFRNSRFKKDVSFASSTFSKEINFEISKFKGYTNFSYSKFFDYAYFTGSVFKDTADFYRSRFSENIDFSDSTFSQKPRFDGAYLGDLAILGVKSDMIDLGNAKINALYAGWELANPDNKKANLTIDMYQKLREYYEKSGYSDDANDCYFALKDKRAKNYEGMEWFLNCLAYWTYGYGVRPLRSIGCSLFIIFSFSIFYWMKDFFGFREAILFSFNTFVSGTGRLFIDTPQLPEKSSLNTRFIFDLERILGLIFISLLVIALTNTFFK